MRVFLIGLFLAGAISAQPTSAEKSQEINYLHRLCGLVTGGMTDEKLALPESAFKIINSKSHSGTTVFPVIAFDPSVHPDGALACVPLSSPGLYWPTGGLYVYKDGSIRAKLSAETSGFRLGLTDDTRVMSSLGDTYGDASNDAAIYETIGWSEFDMVSQGGFFGGAVAEGDAKQIFRGLDNLREGGAVYFEFKSPDGVGAGRWQPFEIDVHRDRARVDVPALWDAIDWKR